MYPNQPYNPPYGSNYASQPWMPQTGPQQQPFSNQPGTNSQYPPQSFPGVNQSYPNQPGNLSPYLPAYPSNQAGYTGSQPSYQPSQPPNLHPYMPNREQQGYSQPGQPGMSAPPNSQMILQKHQINPQMVQRLQLLNQYKIVYILDDSGSMNTVEKSYGYSSSGSSRWNELLQFVNTSLEVALVYNPQGCDIYFLNRQPIRQCRDLNQLRYVFQNNPQGVTPLTRTVQQVINDNPPHMLQGKQLLLIISTDGEPTDNQGHPNVPEFRQCLFSRPQYVFTTIVACTNDQNSVGYLNNLDREVPRLDVVDDYQSELNEVRRAKGPQYPFSFGDYIAKVFLGSIDVSTDSLDL